MPTVLIVDDDPHIREVVEFALRKAGFETVLASDGQQALTLHRSAQPDLVVLDILMPELDGLTVCRELRRISDVPIVLLSSRDEEVDRVLGLDMGADDYVGKPFSPRELVARVNANLRRYAGTEVASRHRLVKVDGYAANEDTFEAEWQGQALDLTQTEFMLLVTLMKRPDKVHTRDELMHGAYPVPRVVSHRTIDSHMRRLRDKLSGLGTPGVRTVHGIGYRLTRA